MCISFVTGVYLHLIFMFQSFQSVEHPSFLCLIHYLCPKLNATDIPKHTCMGNAVMEKVEKLDKIDLDLVLGINSLVSIVYDGWSSKQQHSFASYSIQYIYSPPEDPYHWSMKSHLLEFHQTVGHHTGLMVGNDIVGVIRNFGLEDKVSSLLMQNTNANIYPSSLVGLLVTMYLSMMWQFDMFARLWIHRQNGWLLRRFRAGMSFVLILGYIAHLHDLSQLY
jgi:hypothetical protein